MKQTCQRTCESIENVAQSLSLRQMIASFWPHRLRYNLKFSIEANHIELHYLF